MRSTYRVDVVLRVHQQTTVSQYTPFLHRTGLVIGLVSFMSYSIFHANGGTDLLISVVTELMGPVVMNYMILFHKDFFVKWYDIIAISTQTVIAFGVAVRPVEFPSRNSPPFILVRHSPVAVMFLICALYPTNFWAQFWGQAFGCVVSHIWIHNVCGNMALNAELTKGMNTVLQHLHSCLSTIFVTDFQRNLYGHSCTVSLGFVHYALVFVTPCALKYISESHTRANFLAARLPLDSKESINLVLWENIKFCAYTCALCLVSILLLLPKP